MDEENAVFEKSVIGFRELRNNISEIFENVIYNYNIIESANLKKRQSDSVVILAEKVLQGILYAYTFNPLIEKDNNKGILKISLEEINLYGSGETKEDAAASLLRAVIHETTEFFDNIDINMRIDKQKIKLPYYLKIRQCTTYDELEELLSLKSH